MPTSSDGAGARLLLVFSLFLQAACSSWAVLPKTIWRLQFCRSSTGMKCEGYCCWERCCCFSMMPGSALRNSAHSYFRLRSRITCARLVVRCQLLAGDAPIAKRVHARARRLARGVGVGRLPLPSVLVGERSAHRSPIHPTARRVGRQCPRRRLVWRYHQPHRTV